VNDRLDPQAGGSPGSEGGVALGADPRLYNADLAPVGRGRQTWGWFEIFNVWSNVVQSLFGYALAASLFISYGLNGWAVLAGIVLAGVIIMVLVNLSGRPSVTYGIPFPVMARASMGVFGANFPAMIRAIVAIFWYGAQTYIASTALSLLLTSLVGSGGAAVYGLTPIGWVSLVIVWLLQIVLFWNGIEWIRVFLNWAAPSVYVVMIALTVILWVEAGGDLLDEVGSIFQGSGSYPDGSFAAFMAVTGTMVSYFAAVILNYGDFSRFFRSQRDMLLGNFLGLPVSIAFFSVIALFVTAGTAVVFGARLTDPTEIVARVDRLPLTIVAALTFLAATIGINVVANFVPPANDLSNLVPSRISFRVGGLIAASLALIVGALWVPLISQFGIAHFVNTLGALLAPAYGVMIADFYLIKHGKLDIGQLFSADPAGAYYYRGGWNAKALVAFFIAAVFSVLAVWLPALSVLTGFDWVIGAALSGTIYIVLMCLPSRQPAA